MKLIFFLTLIEIKAYLRNWGAIFWTFAYPVALLVLLSTIFGKPDMQQIKIELTNGQHDKQVQLFVKSLQQRVDMIGGIDLDLVWTDTIPNYTSEEGAIQIKFSENFGNEQVKSSVKLSINGAINQHNGSMLSVISETTEVFNRFITQGEQRVFTDYSDLKVSNEQYNYNAYLISGLTALTVVSTAMFGFCTVLVSMRQNGSLKMFQVFPMSKFQFLAGFILSRTIILLVFCILFFFGANFALHTELEMSAMALLTFTALLFTGIIAFLSAGLVLVSIVKNGSTAVAIVNIVNLPILFLSDLFMPVAMMPEFIRSIAEKSPVYLFVNALRDVSTTNDTSLIVITFTSLFIAGVVSLIISSKTFQWKTV